MSSRHNTVLEALVARLETITVANGYSVDIVQVDRAITPNWRNAPANRLYIVREAIENIVTQQAQYSSAMLVIDVLCLTENPGDAEGAAEKIASLAEDVCNVVMLEPRLKAETSGAGIPGGIIRPVSVSTSREFSERTGRASAIVTFNSPYRLSNL